MPAARRARGFSLLELVAVLAVIAILAAVLLGYLLEYAERAEKAAMEQVASALRASLHLRTAGLIAKNADAAIPRLAEENPMDWLADRPASYVGVYHGVAPTALAPPGSWYFDLRAKELAYRIARSGHLDAPRNAAQEIRFRVLVDVGPLPGGETLPEPLRGLRRAEIVPVEPYRWFPPGG